MIRCRRERAVDFEAALAQLEDLAPATVVLDVEPGIAHWRSDQASLDSSVTRATETIAALPSVDRIVFLTNSRRRIGLSIEGVDYIRRSRKPWRLHGLRAAPGPVAVIGDQIFTDGLIAWRLREKPSIFLQLQALPDTHWWPRLQGHFARPFERTLFNDHP